MFADILSLITRLRAPPAPGMTSASQVHRAMSGEVCLGQAKRRVLASGRRQPPASMALCSRQRRFAIAQAGQKRDPGLETAGNLANVG
jgi:hypothetical protein